MALETWRLVLRLLITLSALLSVSRGDSESQSTKPAHACGQIINALDDQDIFTAALVYECLTSIPFNAAVATRFIAYWNDTLQFQSTLAYLKNPPTTYQQPGVDLVAGLSQLQAAVDAGTFANQYDFEVGLQLLLVSAHDAHLYLDAGVLAAFTFGSPYDIVSLSIDGIQLPKVYIADDVYQSDSFTSFQPSAIKSINGQEVTAHLDAFAANNSYGAIEPHADWNQLMISGAQDIQGYFNAFSGNTIFYPGDTINIQLENGTNVTSEYLGLYWSQGPTGPLETGGDFYNFFVLGYWPASYDPDADDDEGSGDVDPSSTGSGASITSSATATATAPTTPDPTPSGWGEDEFCYPPVADISQPNLGLYGGGYITGYFIDSSSTSVLSIPSFDMSDEALNTAQQAVDEFIKQSKATGREKVVIDLQQNSGGKVVLAFDIFRRFFPNIEPSAGSRMRAHDAADVMGSALTGYYDRLATTNPDYTALAADEWIATTRIDAGTNESFTSWEEFFGPHAYYGDNFTTMQRYNLSSQVFITSSLGDGYDNFTLYSPSPTVSPPYAPEDILLLTDGICGSACSLFVEMMHHQAGVKTVTVGGRPTTGPMQAASGSRGARSYDLTALDTNIGYVQTLLASEGSPQANFLPNRTTANDIYIVDAGINLRDQVRQSGAIPSQFAYEAADCRIFFTPKTIFNYTALWQYAADAIWKNSTLCVAGSTGYLDAGNNTDDSESPPSPSSQPSSQPSSETPYSNVTNYLSSLSNHTSASDSSEPDDLDDGPGGGGRGRGATFKNCRSDHTCSTRGYVCKSVYRCASATTRTPTCVETCSGSPGSHCGGGTCNSKRVSGSKVGLQARYSGFCVPKPASCYANGYLVPRDESEDI